MDQRVCTTPYILAEATFVRSIPYLFYPVGESAYSRVSVLGFLTAAADKL
jgi:hypothetical protein